MITFFTYVDIQKGTKWVFIFCNLHLFNDFFCA